MHTFEVTPLCSTANLKFTKTDPLHTHTHKKVCDQLFMQKVFSQGWKKSTVGRPFGFVCGYPEFNHWQPIWNPKPHQKWSLITVKGELWEMLNVALIQNKREQNKMSSLIFILLYHKTPFPLLGLSKSFVRFHKPHPKSIFLQVNCCYVDDLILTFLRLNLFYILVMFPYFLF